MAPLRSRSLPKNAFDSTFSKLKTASYIDQPRASTSHNIQTLCWNATGTLIATGARDRTLRIWNPEKPNVKNSTELRGHSGAVERVAFSPVNETELATCGSDGMVKFWDVRTKASIGEVKVGGEAFTLAWRPDGSDIVVGKKDDSLIPISRLTFTPITTHRQTVQTNQTLFSYGGDHLFVTDGNGCVKILRYPSFENIHTLNAHTSSCTTVCMSPSGSYLAIGGNDALISLWDTKDWVCMRTLMDLTGPVRSIDFSFDGSYVVGGSDESTGLPIAHTETGEYVHKVETPAPAPQTMWHPSRYVLAYSVDGQGLKIVGGVS